MSTVENCIFCRIASHNIPTDVVFEDDDVFAFHDLNAQSPTHILVIPKKHIPNLASSTSDDIRLLGKLLLTAKSIAETIGITETGFRLVVNNGEHGGQSVDHLHVHLLGGRQLAWPPG